MTFVGYNDSIKYDINGDGLFTNDLDTNGDGYVNMMDWEIGALKIANSWGTTFPGGENSDGYTYLPYRLLARGAVYDYNVFVLKAKEEYSPELTVKASVEYPTINFENPARRKLKFNVGYANNANQTTPFAQTAYSSFNLQGGFYPMQGINFDPIDVGLDFSYWYQNQDVGKIFFIVDELECGTPTDGKIEYFSIVDYRWGEEFELYCDETNVEILQHDETILSIDYDLILHELIIKENYSLYSNMVSRFTPTVDNNATLTVEEGVRIDMYESEIRINAGSSLVLEDDVTFLAKKGSCKIVVDGNISIGSNVHFIAEDGAQLELILNNNSIQANFDYATFDKAKLISYAQNLTISHSTFDDCFIIYSHRGIVNVSETVFDKTWLFIENTEENENSVIVSDCNFSTNYTMVAIDLWNYKNYLISGNTINGFYNGIQIMQSGYGNA